MESVSFALSVALIGMLVVFVGLVILIFSINGIAFASTASDRKAKKAAKAVQSAAEPAPAPVAAPVAAPAAAVSGIPGEVLAAITAAISAVWDGQGGFTVRHVRRIANAPVWNRAGREEQTYSRF